MGNVFHILMVEKLLIKFKKKILGHCANDENEPKLYRYKEECEDACGTLNNRNIIGESIVENKEETTDENSLSQEITYATAAPLPVTNYAVPTTECQRQRDVSSSKSIIKGGFVPECTENGSFKPLQCEPNNLVCFCVNSDGIEIKNSRCLPGQEKPDCFSMLKNFFDKNCYFLAFLFYKSRIY